MPQRRIRLAIPTNEPTAEKVIVEIKVAEHISAAHEHQTLNYLRAAGLSVGLVLNFGPKVETRRMYWSGDRVREKPYGSGCGRRSHPRNRVTEQSAGGVRW